MVEELEKLVRVDSSRMERAGKPEAVFAESKSREEVIEAVKAILGSCGKALVTRAAKNVISEIEREFSDHVILKNERGRICAVFTEDAYDELSKTKERGEVVILSAGTSDIPVAEEAAFTAEFLGLKVKRFYDVGVAGLHRLVEPVEYIRKSKAIAVIVVAGMEGALPSVVAGLVDRPVIAVPTSVGYGVAFNGLTALFSMLLSCPSGVAVVNIDNGFGAAVFAHTIFRAMRLTSTDQPD